MSADPLSLMLPAVGVFMDESAADFTAQKQAGGLSFIHSTTNMVIEERRFKTRAQWRELSLTSAPDGYLTANTQGVLGYNPARDANAFNPTSGSPGLIESAAGKLYRLTPDRFSYKVEDISSGIQGRPSMRLAWLTQAATYFIRTDGASPTQIFNGRTTSTSTGFNRDAPPSSRLPNFAGPLCYAQRVWITNNDTEVLAGDFIHRTDLQSNDDVLKMTDQSLDITSRSFTAPVDMGPVISMHVVTSARGGDLPVQSEIVAGCEDGGMWGILGGSPRDRWATLPMVRIIHPEVGPTGPYAAWAANDELLFRSKEGLSSIKYAGRETSQVGNPHINIGNEIKPLLDADAEDLLIYASVHASPRRQRMACTVGPRILGAHRWHRGFVTATFSPGRTRVPEGMVWEGVSTLPASMGEVIQFCEVRDRGTRRWMALIRKADGTKGLAEWTTQWNDDRLADGTMVPIPWQVLTRRLAPAGDYGKSNFSSAYLSLTDIRDKVDITISVRNKTSAPFKQVFAKSFSNKQWAEATAGYADAEPLALGPILKDFSGSPWIQILIQGTGCCIVDLAVGKPGGGSALESVGTPATCHDGEALCQFDPFLRAP